MCMIDGAEPVTVLHEREYTARREHRCNECRTMIRVGEKYTVERYVAEGRAETHKTCAHCWVVRQWLLGECGGFVYEMLDEDIREHADEGIYGFGVKLLAIGIDRQWTRKNGARWPIPRLPLTTHEKMKTQGVQS